MGKVNKQTQIYHFHRLFNSYADCGDGVINLINFMSLSQELNDAEYDAFKSKILKLIKRQYFERALFLSLRDAPKQIAPLSKMVSKIINARKSKPKNDFKYDRLDLIPSPLIGKCASFLNQRYHSFGRVNRKIYTSSFSPCQLYKVRLKNIPSKMMQRYKFAKTVEIKPSHFNNLSKQNQSIWKPNKLILSNVSDNEYELLTNKLKIDTDKFIANQPFAFKNIEHLTLRSYNFYPFSSFLSLLSAFPMMQSLEFDDSYLSPTETEITTNEIRKMIPNLENVTIGRGCSVITGRLITQIFTSLQSQLKSISIRDVMCINDHKYPNLESIQMIDIEPAKLKNVLHQTTSLKNVSIIYQHPHKHWCFDELPRFVGFIFSKQLHLHSFEIKTKLNILSNVIGEMKNVLDGMHDRKGMDLNISLIVADRYHEFDEFDDVVTAVKNLMTRIDGLMKSFGFANVKTFKICIKLQHFLLNLDFGQENFKNVLAAWSYSWNEDYYVKGQKNSLIISNKIPIV